MLVSGVASKHPRCDVGSPFLPRARLVERLYAIKALLLWSWYLEKGASSRLEEARARVAFFREAALASALVGTTWMKWWKTLSLKVVVRRR